ncbi:TIGR02594 family protein [Methylorubrum extorquens]
MPDGIAGPKTQAALQKADISERREAPDKPGWLVLAEALDGIKEAPGAKNNPEVVKLFADASFPGIKTDSTAWFAAFVNAVLEHAGHRGSRSLAARSFESWVVGLPAPTLGAIATKKRNGSAWQGHTGLVVGANATQVFLLGGNQSDAVNVAAFKRSEIVAYGWSADVPLPAPHTLPTTIAGARSGVSEA